MDASPLITADALQAQVRAAAPAPVLIDVGFDLVDTTAGERAWAAGHVPGAVYLHLERDLSGAKTGANGRHPLPERAAFAATLGRIGVAPGVPVVAMDRQGGSYAARLWWMLRWIGHAEVRVLDGGVPAWTESGGVLDTAVPSPTACAPYPECAPLVRSIDTATLAAGLGRRRILDARAGERFRGEVEPLDRVAGHIPGATHRFFKDNLDARGRFKPSATLHAEFGALIGRDPAAETVHQCGSGVTACHNLLAMAHAGLPLGPLYPGSWSEWSADPSRPVARG